MSKVIKSASRTLRIESIKGGTGAIDVSVLRDFVRTLDEHGVDGRAPVDAHRTDAGHLAYLTVTVNQLVPFDHPAVDTGPPTEQGVPLAPEPDAPTQRCT